MQFSGGSHFSPPSTHATQLQVNRKRRTLPQPTHNTFTPSSRNNMQFDISIMNFHSIPVPHLQIWLLLDTNLCSDVMSRLPARQNGKDIVYEIQQSIDPLFMLLAQFLLHAIELFSDRCNFGLSVAERLSPLLCFTGREPRLVYTLTTLLLRGEASGAPICS